VDDAREETMKQQLKMAAAGFLVTLLIICGGILVYSQLSKKPAPPSVDASEPVMKHADTPMPSAKVQPVAGTAAPAGPPASAPASPAKPVEKPSAKPEEKPASGAAAASAAKTPAKSAGVSLHFPTSGKIQSASEWASISGMVVDESGNPVAGAQVTVVSTGFDKENETDFALAFMDKEHLAFAIASASGQYEVSGIKFSGLAVIRAYADGSSGRAQVGVKPGESLQHVDVTVGPGVALAGRVIHVGAPVADAVVTAVAFVPESGPFSEAVNGGNVAVTDENGDFRIGFRGRGMAALEATSKDFGQALFQDIPVGGSSPVELRLQKPASLMGHVTARGNQAGFTVVLTRVWEQRNANADGSVTGIGPVYSAEVGQDGKYLIPAVDPGAAYQAIVRSASKPLTDPKLAGPFEPGQTQVLDFTVEGEIVIRGHLLGAQTGQPLGNAYVLCKRKDGGDLNAPNVRVKFDGTFEIQTAGGGSYILVPRYTPTGPDIGLSQWMREVNCESGDTFEVDLMLPEPCVLPVRVVDAMGAPVPGVGVYLGSMDETGVVHMSERLGATDNTGLFVCANVMPGVETWAEVGKEGENRARTRHVVGQPGEPLSEEVVAFFSTSGVEGFAVAPDGTPLANVGISLFIVTSDNSPQAGLSATTDPGGHFVVKEGIPGTPTIINMFLKTGEEAPPMSSVGPIQCIPGQILNLGAVVFLPQ
jgi:hypothetical protein